MQFSRCYGSIVYNKFPDYYLFYVGAGDRLQGGEPPSGDGFSPAWETPARLTPHSGRPSRSLEEHVVEASSCLRLTRLTFECLIRAVEGHAVIGNGVLELSEQKVKRTSYIAHARILSDLLWLVIVPDVVQKGTVSCLGVKSCKCVLFS